MTDVRTYRYFVDGKWVFAANGQTFDDVKPYTGSVCAKVAASGAAARRPAPARAEVADLIEKLGFHGIDLGLLNEGGRTMSVPGGAFDDPEPDPARLSRVASIIVTWEFAEPIGRRTFQR